MKASSVKRLLGIGALALLLSGCVRVNLDIELSPENTVAGSAVIAVDQDLLQLSGQTEQQLFDQMDLSSNLPDNADISRYEEDGFIGQQVTFDDMPLDEFQQSDTLAGAGTGDDLNIERVGDEFVVTGGLDMSGPEFTGGQVPQQFLDNIDFRISMTFPGPVTESTGDVDGNTVTWEPTFGENNPIEARASAIPSESSPWLMIVLIAGGALLLGGLAYVLTHRSKPAPAAGPMDAGTTAPIDPSMAAAAPVEAPSAPMDAPPAPLDASPTPMDAPPSPTQPVPPAAPEPPTEPIAPGEATTPVTPEESTPPEASGETTLDDGDGDGDEDEDEPHATPPA